MDQSTKPEARSMNISAIEILTVNLPFRFAFKHSLASRSSSTNLIVRVKLSDGTAGYGESIPREYVSGETIESAAENIEKRLGPQLVGLDVSDLATVRTQLGDKFRELGLESL